MSYYFVEFYLTFTELSPRISYTLYKECRNCSARIYFKFNDSTIEIYHIYMNMGGRGFPNQHREKSPVSYIHIQGNGLGQSSLSGPPLPIPWYTYTGE